MATTQIWQRARQPEQKEQRRGAILAAAAELFAADGFERVSLNAVASAAGISKSNIYRYFESKEEIFFELLLTDTTEWVASVERSLAPLGGSGDLAAVAAVLSQSLNERPRLTALISVTASVLERNVGEETIVRVKTAMLDVVVRGANALHAAVPELSLQQARELPFFLHTLVTGLWPSAHPSQAVAEVLSRPQFADMCVRMERDLERGILLLLRGMVAEKQS